MTKMTGKTIRTFDEKYYTELLVRYRPKPIYLLPFASCQKAFSPNFIVIRSMGSAIPDK